jgi:hypothetical protein
MLPLFKRDADGGLTFYVQNESPGAEGVLHPYRQADEDDGRADAPGTLRR